jgi:hypothetical protein
MTIPEVFVTPLVRHFGPTEEAELVRTLSRLERTTTVRCAGRPDELCLDRDGRLPSGFHYTESAFRQVCTIAARGLYQVVLDLAGIWRPGVTAPGDYSFAGAIELFNSVIRRRFQSRFAGKVQLVRDVDPVIRLVDGIIGPKYRYLENRVLYDMAREAAASARPALVFRGAVLAGRHFMVRYTTRAPLCAVTIDRNPEPFYGGYHFSNSEIAGEASVRAARLLLHDPTGNSSLERAGKGRLAHIGKEFERRLARLFQATVGTTQDPAVVRRRIEAALATSLGLGGTEAAHAARVEHLSLVLHRYSIPRPLAYRMVVATANYGHGPVGKPRPPSSQVLVGRTVYDLYTALTREAGDQPVSLRETIEEAAHGLLAGKIRLG